LGGKNSIGVIMQEGRGDDDDDDAMMTDGLEEMMLFQLHDHCRSERIIAGSLPYQYKVLWLSSVSKEPAIQVSRRRTKM